MNDPKKQQDFYYLVLRCLEGVLTPEEFAELDKMIASDPELAKLYVNLISINSDLCKPGQIGTFLLKESAHDEPFDSDTMTAVMEAMAQDEKTAPAKVVEIEHVPEIIKINKAAVSHSPRKVNRFSLCTAVLSLAALLFLMAYIHFVPPKYASEPVAIITDTIGAQWANASGFLEEGTHLSTSQDSFILSKGIVKFLFDNQARIVLEGPAEFELLRTDQMVLHYGRLYAIVPPEALGFTITTRNSKIIDLGTEFGVEAGLDSTTELHVLQGRTTLISGEKENKKTSVMVTEGVAKKISGADARVSDILCNQKKFVREIRSRDKFIWRGENLKLASIVAGRDGFQEVGSLIGLNPATGEFTTSIVRNDRTSKNIYNLVPDSKFIDGVFVPDGGMEEARIPVTSMGHTFECSNTSGLFTHEIAAYKGSIEGQHTTIPPIIFNGERIEKESQSVLVLHSNMGITFDLQAIRESTGLDMKNFKAWGGLTEQLGDSKEDLPDVDFWILVDGQIRYEKKRLKIEDGTISFDVVVSPEDRFLTLVVTDGLRKEDGKRDFAYGNDFFFLIDPELSLTASTE